MQNKNLKEIKAEIRQRGAQVFRQSGKVISRVEKPDFYTDKQGF